MNAAFGFRFAAAFFAILSPCDGRQPDVLTLVRSIMPTPARLYYCFQRGNAKKSHFSEGKRLFPEEKTAFLEKCGVVGDVPGRTRGQRRPHRVRQRELGQRAWVDEHVDRFRGGDRRRLAGNPERRADGERRRSEPDGGDRQLQHLIETRRRLPFDRLLDELKVEVSLEKRG